MHIYASFVIKNDNGVAAVLDKSFNLDSFSIFYKYTIKEFITFTCKELVKNVENKVVDEDKNVVFYINHISSIHYILVCDLEYPEYVAFGILHKMNDNLNPEYIIKHFQKPEDADSLYRSKKTLDETVVVIQNTITKVLERGENIDRLVQESEDLGIASKMFYQKAKEQNKCCVVM